MSASRRGVFLLCSGFAAVIMAAPAAAQERLVGAPIGAWRVMGEPDPMTDKNQCVAYFGAGSAVQLTLKSFGISYRGRGGLQGYTIRFDNDPPFATALPTRIEKEIGALIIDAGDPRYQRLTSAKRVRVQALTLLTSIVNNDVDLSRLPEVLARLNGPNCQ